MIHLINFSNFKLNENQEEVYANINDQALDKIIDIIGQSTKNSLILYLALRKIPKIFKSLERRALQKNLNLKDFIVPYIKKDPLGIHLLDNDPELKAEILKLSNVEDFSRLGRLKNVGIIK